MKSSEQKGVKHNRFKLTHGVISSVCVFAFVFFKSRILLPAFSVLAVFHDEEFPGHAVYKAMASCGSHKRQKTYYSFTS